MSDKSEEEKTAYLCPMCKGRKQIDTTKHELWSPGDASFFCDCILCNGHGFVVK
jgi:hypothetical protein